MHSGDAMPVVRADATLTDAIVEISEKRLGMTAAVDEGGQVVGVFTDGDLRRALGRGLDPHVTRVEDVMSGNPAAIEPDTLAVEAVQRMQDRKVQGLLVLDENGDLVGVLNFQDLLHSGVV
jgi:arabinose-5-phosphate isomerase